MGSSGDGAAHAAGASPPRSVHETLTPLPGATNCTEPITSLHSSSADHHSDAFGDIAKPTVGGAPTSNLDDSAHHHKVAPAPQSVPNPLLPVNGDGGDDDKNIVAPAPHSVPNPLLPVGGGGGGDDDSGSGGGDDDDDGG